MVDWRGSIIAEGQMLWPDRDWGRFADRWRAGYAPAMHRVRTGALPWTRLDALHRMILDSLIDEFELDWLDEDGRQAFNNVWHRLRPWPDSVAGLTRLRSKFLAATLSNGNVCLLAEMAKYAGLPWDVILSAELFRHYKPDPEVYLGAAELLDCAPGELMMVAAHAADLRAARDCGLRTAFIARPDERGPATGPDIEPGDRFDIMATSLPDLARQLAC